MKRMSLGLKFIPTGLSSCWVWNTPSPCDPPEPNEGALHQHLKLSSPGQWQEERAQGSRQPSMSPK